MTAIVRTMITIAVALGMVFSGDVLAQEDPSVGSRAECETDGGTWMEDYEADGDDPDWFRGYEGLEGIVGRDFCAQDDPEWPQQKTECEADGGIWIEVYEGVGRPAGWFEDPYLPGWCVTAEELEKATPAEQETDPAQVESTTTQTELSLPPPATEPEPSTELPATQPAQAQQGTPQYTG
jgi:hypothetical protein